MHLQERVNELFDVIDDWTRDRFNSFDCKVTITMNMDLAKVLADFILDSPNRPNTALLALAHNIENRQKNSGKTT